MKLTPILVIFFGILLSIGLLGCGGGGGGGGGGAAAPDAPAITARLNAFAQAVAKGNVVEATKYMSPRIAALGGGGTLIIKTFGSDINDPNDDDTFTFIIPNGGILQAGDVATVRAEYTTTAGVTISLLFALLREDGAWYIDGIEVTNTSTTAYRLAPWFQVRPGNSWTYKIKYGNGLESSYKVRYSVAASTLSRTFLDPTTSTNKTVTAYSLVPEALDSSGNPITPISSLVGTPAQDDPEPRFSWNSSFAPETFSGDAGTLYFGMTGSEVAPWQMIPEEVELDKSYPAPADFVPVANGAAWSPTTYIGGWVTIGSLNAIEVRIVLVAGSPGDKFYLNQNYGIIKFEKYNSSGQVIYEEILDQTTIDGTTTNPPTSSSSGGAVATPTMNIQARQIDSSHLKVSFWNPTDGTQLDPESASALNTDNYVLYKKKTLKTGGATTLETYSVQGATLDSSGAKKEVEILSDTDLRDPTLQVAVTGVYSADRTRITASKPIDLEDHVKFYSYKPWSDFGVATFARRIVRPSLSSSNGTLFLVFPSAIRTVTVSETTDAAGEKVLSYGAAQSWTSAFTAGESFVDLALATNGLSPESEVGYWVTGNDTGGAFIAFLNQNGTGLVKHYLSTMPGNAVFGRGFTFSNGQTYVVVGDDQGNVQSYRWFGSAPAPSLMDSRNPAGSGPGVKLPDIQAYKNGDSVRLIIWGQNSSPSLNDLVEYNLTTGGLFSVVVDSWSNWTGLTDPGSMHWMINNESAGLTNSMLFVSGVAGIGQMGQVDISSSPAVKHSNLIVDSATAGPGPDYQGGIRNLSSGDNAATIEVFKSPSSNGAAEKDYWILVGDYDGLTVYRYR